MGLGRGVFTRRKERSTEGRQAEEKRRDTRRRGDHEEEDDGSEASSTVLGYSLPVSWGPRCTRTILFLFLFFVTHSFPLFPSTGLDLLSSSSRFFLPPIPSLPLGTFLRLRRLYQLFLFLSLSFSLSRSLRLLSRLLNSVTKPSSHLFNALLAFQDPPRRSAATLQLATSCARVLPPSLWLSVLPLPFLLVSSSSCTSSSVYSRVEQVCRIRYHLITILEREQTLLSTTFRRQEGRDCFFFSCLFTSVNLMVFRYVLWEIRGPLNDLWLGAL